MEPKFKVCWLKKTRCPICGYESTFEQTYGFFKAEDAIKHAVDVLNEGCSILYIEL